MYFKIYLTECFQRLMNIKPLKDFGFVANSGRDLSLRYVVV